MSPEEVRLANIYTAALKRKAKAWSEKRVAFHNAFRNRLTLFATLPHTIHPSILDAIAEMAADEYARHLQQRTAIKARHKKARESKESTRRAIR